MRFTDFHLNICALQLMSIKKQEVVVNRFVVIESLRIHVKILSRHNQRGVIKVYKVTKVKRDVVG